MEGENDMDVQPRKVMKREIKTVKTRDSHTERLFDNWGVFPVTSKFVILLYIAVGLSLSGFHLYIAYFGLIEAWAVRAVHVTLVLLLIYLMPRSKSVD